MGSCFNIYSTISDITNYLELSLNKLEITRMLFVISLNNLEISLIVIWISDISNLFSDISNSPMGLQTQNMQATPALSMFQPTTAKQIEDLIAAAPNKHYLLDPAPTSLINNCTSLLSPYLSVLFNRLLEEACYRYLRKRRSRNH